MAEGFLEDSQGEKVAEEVDDNYFVELLSRSLIQQSNDVGRGEKFVMHDLVNDLATIVSGKISCRLECGKISENVRHLSYDKHDYHAFKKFAVCYKFKCLRSFLPLDPYLSKVNLFRKLVDDLLHTLKRLRVLSLSNYENITILPDSIGNLGQLRYLDLSNTCIKRLPETTYNLYNLQTLILCGCRFLTELSEHIGKLVNLRHLDISGVNIKEIPMQITGLKDLRTLTVFIVGKQQMGLSIRELRKFPHLQGKLSIENLHNVMDAMEACDANLKNKEQIEELELKWGKATENSQTEKVLLDMLQPLTNLKKLSIDFYGGTSFPSWLGDSSFSNMVYLCISCDYCVTLPSLGQLPCLKDLRVSLMTLETIGPEFYGSSFQPFPSLEYLQFSWMQNWKEWLPFESCEFSFPRLQNLELTFCPELRDFPKHLSSINKISIYRCNHLMVKWSLLESDSPCLLQRVNISQCDILLCLPKMILSSTYLQRLYLFHIPSLFAFPADGLPTSLNSLNIDCCENLTFLPLETWSHYTSLEDLTIHNSCNSLTSFPLDGFPALESLFISQSSSLESIFILETSSVCLPNLRFLWVFNYKALRSLPQHMDTLTSLEHLSLLNLPKLEFSFSEGACLPSKLRNIQIHSLPLTVKTELDLRSLTALSYLSIKGDDVFNTLLKGKLLPICLASLSIHNLSKTKSLEGNGLRHLSSLEYLSFDDCPSLEYLSKDMLPSSLQSLHIWRCPLLEAKYESQRGEHWSNIAHIPVITINNEVVI